VVENLRAIDSVGVLIFDNSFQWAVPIRKAEDRAAIKKLISGITPDGGTQIAPALTKRTSASAPAMPSTAIVLLTDGLRRRHYDPHPRGAAQSRYHLHRGWARM
jgi:Mg-chelatase subunit ChlD